MIVAVRRRFMLALLVLVGLLDGVVGEVLRYRS